MAFNFNIQNISEEDHSIDILGEIGESFFDDGVTMQSVNDSLSQIKAKNITVNISSLGGSLVHALAIHDMLKLHPANITTNVIGMTASSGTIIAMAGDTVNMSDNAMFLVHNASMALRGNAEDMREAANDLDKFDGIIAGLYQKRINSKGKNKKKSEILSLMENEKWISADEAISFGFVDTKILSKNIIKNEIIEQINASDLPNINDVLDANNNKMEVLNKIKNFFGVETEKEITNELFDSKVVEIDAIKVENDALKAELETLKAEQLTAKEVEDTRISDLTNEVDHVTAEKLELNNKVEALELEINQLKAEKTNVVNQGDPNVSAEKIELTAGQKAAKEAMAGIKDSITLHTKKQ